MDLKEYGVYWLFVILTWINILNVKTWLSNEFFYVKNPNEKINKSDRVWGFIGEFLFLIWICVFIYVIKMDL